MYRKIIKNLIQWKSRGEKRKPLVLNGARQIGKTYILKEFGEKNYKNTVYINFEADRRASLIFEDDIDAKSIIRKLERHKKTKILPEETLIIFDEVQECDRALTSLKYINEDANEYHVIAAGSLLGVAINKGKKSFPVGKVEFIQMYPMDFEEYLIAFKEKELIEQIKECFKRNEKIDKFYHKEALLLYAEYLWIGGMPEAINEAIDTQKNYERVRRIHSFIIDSYIIDMAKYATPSQGIKNVATFATIPAQLAKNNHKFQYKLIKRGASSTHFGESIDWLVASKSVMKCNRLSEIRKPIIAYMDFSVFKLYMCDIGLFITKLNFDEGEITPGYGELGQYKGAIAETYVAQALNSNGYPLYYWEPKSQVEVDFIIKTEDGIIPIEVKAADNTRSRSLKSYIDRNDPKYSIRISSKNFGFENRIKSVPLYAVFCI